MHSAASGGARVLAARITLLLARSYLLRADLKFSEAPKALRTHFFVRLGRFFARTDFFFTRAGRFSLELNAFSLEVIAWKVPDAYPQAHLVSKIFENKFSPHLRPKFKSSCVAMAQNNILRALREKEREWGSSSKR